MTRRKLFLKNFSEEGIETPAYLRRNWLRASGELGDNQVDFGFIATYKTKVVE